MMITAAASSLPLRFTTLGYQRSLFNFPLATSGIPRILGLTILVTLGVKVDGAAPGGAVSIPHLDLMDPKEIDPSHLEQTTQRERLLLWWKSRDWIYNSITNTNCLFLLMEMDKKECVSGGAHHILLEDLTNQLLWGINYIFLFGIICILEFCLAILFCVWIWPITYSGF